MKSKSIDRNYQMTMALWYLLCQRCPQTQDHTQTAEKTIDSIWDYTLRDQSPRNNPLSTRTPWEADSGPLLGIGHRANGFAAPTQYAQTQYRRKQGNPSFPLKKKTEQCLTSPCEWQFWGSHFSVTIFILPYNRYVIVSFKQFILLTICFHFYHVKWSRYGSYLHGLLSDLKQGDSEGISTYMSNDNPRQTIIPFILLDCIF